MQVCSFRPTEATTLPSSCRAFSPESRVRESYPGSPLANPLPVSLRLSRALILRLTDASLRRYRQKRELKQDFTIHV